MNHDGFSVMCLLKIYCNCKYICIYTVCIAILYTDLVVICLILEMLDGNVKYCVMEVPCLTVKTMMGNICMI
jgi:hypothetical protein